MALAQAFAQSINDLIHRNTAITLAAARKLKLCSTTGTSTAAGTEITAGGNYPAGGVAVTFTASSAATPSVSANDLLTITNMPAAGTIASVEITDNGATPVRMEFGALTTARSTAAGDTLSIAAGALTSALQ